MTGPDRPDVIVVGSGASAVHAAWPLVMAGCRVVMLDVGTTDEVYAPLIPDRSFGEIRRGDAAQHRYFLGDRFEGVPFGSTRVGAQLTPPRAFVNRGVEDLTPVESRDFRGMESLARGGLASAWGAGVGRFSAADLAGLPVGPADLEPHYAAVERRIGISGDDDDLTEALGLHAAMMPALPVDTVSLRILQRYRRDRTRHIRSGFRMGITRLAACSREWNGRGPHRLDDLDFWSDKARAVYRPLWTLSELAMHPNFSYRPGLLALRFREAADSVTVACRRTDGAEEQFEARSLVLAAGVFGTARIVLRSLGLYRRPVPYVCNPYTYAPCLNPGMIGREAADARHSLSQLTGTFLPVGTGWPEMHVSIYSYRSLLTFKLMKESPLSARSSLRVMRALQPLLIILGLHHADDPADGKSVALLPAEAGAPERLAIAHHEDPAVSDRIDRQERRLLGRMRRLGCYPLKRIRPGPGSSIHYAGTFPMSDAPGELQTGSDGRLAGTGQVYLADGSLLPRLPAKGPTLTFMANADRIGTLLAARLRP